MFSLFLLLFLLLWLLLLLFFSLLSLLLVVVVVVAVVVVVVVVTVFVVVVVVAAVFVVVVVAERLHIVELALWRFQPIPKQKLEQIEIIILLRWTVKHHIKRRPGSYIPMFVAKVAVDVSQLNTSIYEYWVLCLGQGKTMSLEVVAFASPYVCVYIYICVCVIKKKCICLYM